MHYHVIQKIETDNFIIDSLFHSKNNDFFKSLISLVYYFISILFKGQTPGDTLLGFKPESKKSLLIISYLFNLISKYYSKNNIFIRLIYKFSDLFSFLNFLMNDNKKYSPNYYPIHQLFNIKYSYEFKPNNNYLLNDNILFIKNLIYTELSDLMIILLPKKFNYKYPLINNKFISNLCVICKNECTNTIKFSCGHKYCYYCYRINQKKDSINEVCIICHKL